MTCKMFADTSKKISPYSANTLWFSLAQIITCHVATRWRILWNFAPLYQLFINFYPNLQPTNQFVVSKWHISWIQLNSFLKVDWYSWLHFLKLPWFTDSTNGTHLSALIHGKAGEWIEFKRGQYILFLIYCTFYKSSTSFFIFATAPTKYLFGTFPYWKTKVDNPRENVQLVLLSSWLLFYCYCFLLLLL